MLERYVSALGAALHFHFLRYWREYLIGVVGFLALGWSLYTVLLAPPLQFPVSQVITVKKGSALPAIAAELSAEHVIRQPLLFEALVRLSGSSRVVRADVYRFNEPTNLLQVTARLLSGTSGIAPVRITFTEGETALDMSEQVASAFPDISQSDFLSAAEPYEGYLFPDTYEFAPDATPQGIVQTMLDNFNAKIATIAPEIESSGHSLSDIVIMASIVEKEAQTPEDKQIVAGILWKRIAEGIPLQVDAVFGYIENRNEFAPSLADLSVDSPYNTYEHKGLPPGPISNPGLVSLEAAADPEQTNYLYYLTGNDGLMHYAATYAGHQANIAKYLK